ncbi:restriction endonuclease subunit S [Enterococcus faecium]
MKRGYKVRWRCLSMSNDTQPEIRFPGFTEAWEQRKLGEFVTIRSGWSPSNFEEANDKGSLFVKVDDLNSSTRVQNNSNMKVIENPKYDKMKQGSTIFPKRGAAIMTNKVRILGENGYMDTNMMALEPSGIVGEFLYTFISRTGLYKIADTSTIPQINNKHIEPYEISLPEIKEQQKIGIFFKQLDDTITLHQSKLDLLKKTKKGFLQKMFPKNGAKVPEIRFPGFTEDWEERKLRDITERVRGNDGRMDLPTLTISASSGWLDQRDRFSGNIAGKEQKNYTLLKKGQLSYNHGNSKLAKYGVVCELTTYDEALVPRVYHSFDTNELASSNFIEYMFATKRPDRELAKLVSSGARMDGLLNINFDEFMGINVSVPSVEEQQKIGAFFKQLDDTITLHQRKLDLLKETKKGFLQKMFV